MANGSWICSLHFERALLLRGATSVVATGYVLTPLLWRVLVHGPLKLPFVKLAHLLLCFY